MKVILDGKEYEEGMICGYEDVDAKVTGEIRFGEWIQDGSGGEYSGAVCYGFYVHVTNLESLSWNDETKEELEDYYPDFRRNVSLLSLIRDCNISDFRILNQRK